MQSLNDMAIFAAVVEASSFSLAAQKLGISTPVVSKRISALEKNLGARLLFRTTRRISLTEVGTVFYQHCQTVVAEAKKAEAAVTNLNDEPRGLLRVTAPITFGTHQVAKATSGFLARYPEIQMELDISDRSVDLAKEAYDIAIRVTHQPPELNSARLLTHSRRIVCAAPSYWQQHGKPQTPNALYQHNCIIYTLNNLFNTWMFQQADSQVTINVQGRFKVNDANAMLEAAIGGLGVTMLSSFMVESAIEMGLLEPALEDYSHQGTSIYALYLPNKYLSAKTRAFIDYMVEWS